MNAISDARLELLMDRGEAARGFLAREKAVRHGAMPGSRPGLKFSQKAAKTPTIRKPDQFGPVGSRGPARKTVDTARIVALYAQGYGVIEIGRQMGLGRNKVGSELKWAGVQKRTVQEARVMSMRPARAA